MDAEEEDACSASFGEEDGGWEVGEEGAGVVGARQRFGGQIMI